MAVSLASLINDGYRNQSVQEQHLKSKGYVKDKELSNSNTQVFYNQDKKHLIKNTMGTQRPSDWGTNLANAVGLGKSTERYQEEKNTLEKAKKKHKPETTTLTGSSLGGYLSHITAQKGDKVVTLNRPSIPLSKIPSNETHYRVKGDPVSIFSANAKRTKTLEPTLSAKWYPNLELSLASKAYAAHSSKNLPKNIFV
jgi:hypothetical protein